MAFEMHFLQKKVRKNVKKKSKVFEKKSKVFDFQKKKIKKNFSVQFITENKKNMKKMFFS